LQLAKCTYAGMRANSPRKSGLGQDLIFSEENPNCALRAAFRGDFHPSRRFPRAQEVPGISPKWAQNGPKSAVFEEFRAGIRTGSRLMSGNGWRRCRGTGILPTTPAGSPCCTGCPTSAAAHPVDPRSLPGLPDRCRSDSAGGRSTLRWRPGSGGTGFPTGGIRPGVGPGGRTRTGRDSGPFHCLLGGRLRRSRVGAWRPETAGQPPRPPNQRAVRRRKRP
jgi:hypothetical protein